MNHDRFVDHEHPVPFIVTPDAFRFRVRRCSTEDSTEHRERMIDPARLIDRRRAVPVRRSE